MGGRQSKRSVDITTTPKKEGMPAEGGVVGDAAAPGDGKLERIEEADSKPTTNGIAPHTDLTPEDKEKDKDEATEKSKEKQPAEELKAEETKEETSGESPVEAAEVTTPTEAAPAGANAATSPDSKETKKKDKMKKKWSFRSISFNKKDKSKPAREDAPKNGDVTKEEPLAEGGEEVENATTASPTEDKSAVSSPADSENGTTTTTTTAAAAVPATESASSEPPPTESTTESGPASESGAATTPPAPVAAAPAPSPPTAVTAVEAKEEPAAPVAATTEAAAANGSSTEEKKEESTPSAPSPILVEDKKEEVEKLEPEKAVEVSPAADGGDHDRMMKPVFQVQPVAASSIIERKTSEESQSPSQFPSSPPPTPIDPSPLQQAQQAAASATALAEALKLPAEAADEEEATFTLAQHSPSTLMTSTDARTSFAPTDHEPANKDPPTMTHQLAPTVSSSSTASASFSSSSSPPLIIESKPAQQSTVATPPKDQFVELTQANLSNETQVTEIIAPATALPHALISQLEDTEVCPLLKKDASNIETFIKPDTDFDHDARKPPITESQFSHATTASLEKDVKVETACALDKVIENVEPKTDEALPVAFVKEELVDVAKKLEATTDDSYSSESGNVNVEASAKSVSSILNIDDTKAESVPTEINEASDQALQLEKGTIELERSRSIESPVVSIDSSKTSQKQENASVLAEVVDESIEIIETTGSREIAGQSPSQEPIIESPSSSFDVVVESEESPLSLSGAILVEAKPAFVIPENETAEELADTDDSKADNTESVEVIVEPESDIGLRTEEFPISDDADEASIQDDLNAISEKTNQEIVSEKLSKADVTAASGPEERAIATPEFREKEETLIKIEQKDEEEVTNCSLVVEATASSTNELSPSPKHVVSNEDSINFEYALAPPRSPTPQSLPNIPSSTGIAATTRDSSQTLLNDEQSSRELKTEPVSVSLNSFNDLEVELKERLASPADTVEESLLSGRRRRYSNDVSVGAVQEHHQSTPEAEAPVENNIAHEVSPTESVDEAPKVAPPAVPIEVPASPPIAPAITEDVASVTKAIEEITISDKAVAAAVNESIECVNTNEIIADAHHQNNLNE